VELRCKEWKITEKIVLDDVESFISNPPGGGRLEFARLLFYLGQGMGQKPPRKRFGVAWLGLLKTTSFFRLRLVLSVALLISEFIWKIQWAPIEI
jgi:hypothetical protein